MSEQRKNNDNDLAKIIIRWPVGLDPGIGTLLLTAKGIWVDSNAENMAPVIGDAGQSRLRFYSESGARINSIDNPETNLMTVAGGRLQELREKGYCVLYIDGAELFGCQEPYLEPVLGEHNERLKSLAADAASRMGAAFITLQAHVGGVNTLQNLTVYRGGFWRFVLPATNAPLPARGVLGTLEFRDGKGRISRSVTHNGNLLGAYPARSGLSNGSRWDVTGEGGHMPPGWYYMYRRTDFRGSQRDVRSNGSKNLVIRQGSYVRWQQDDATSPTQRYTNDYIYNAAYTRDSNIGLPTVARFKWQLEPIPPDTAANRTQLQMHPDGRKNGTMGCVGIQAYNDCLSVNAILQRYHQLSLLVEIQTTSENEN
jgi:hypothetical protein